MIKLSDKEFGMIKKIGALLKRLSWMISDEKQDDSKETLSNKNKIKQHRTTQEQKIFDNDGI
jgi:hypothetical protein